MGPTAEAYVRLQSCGLSLTKQTRLVKGLGNADAVFAAPDDELAAHCERLTRTDLEAIHFGSRVDVSDYMAQLAAQGGRVVGYGMVEYPPLLAETEDAPPILYARGTLTNADRMAVAIVGTRRCTSYGQDVTEKLAGGLARRGFTVVSGLAVGIDAHAHQGALDAGGRTIGVMACGLDIEYPKSNLKLREQMVESGAVLTEMPLGKHPSREVFPQRNRIVAGMTSGTLVVEAPTKSGALITANLAIDYSREVFAVPGPVGSPVSRGCHALIKDGARLVETVEDIIDGLGLMLQAVPERRPAEQAPANLNPNEQAVIDGLAAGPRNLDQLVAETHFPAAAISASLMLLEVKQAVKRMPDGTFARLI